MFLDTRKYENFEDAKCLNRNRKLKDRQYNGQNRKMVKGHRHLFHIYIYIYNVYVYYLRGWT
jgi:hypothetical protein